MPVKPGTMMIDDPDLRLAGSFRDFEISFRDFVNLGFRFRNSFQEFISGLRLQKVHFWASIHYDSKKFFFFVVGKRLYWRLIITKGSANCEPDGSTGG